MEISSYSLQMPVDVAMKQPKARIVGSKPQSHIARIGKHASVLVRWSVMCGVRDASVPNHSRHRFLVEHPHVQDVKPVTVQVDRMGNKVVHINDHKLDNRIEVSFNAMHTSARGDITKSIVGAKLSDSTVFIAEHRFINHFGLRKERK
jgi:hypothetical protein